MNLEKINFNAGPAALPAIVIKQAAHAVLQYKDTGISILELPHRGPEFLAIIEESKALVKELCNLGNDHEVLWLQGGGRLQFSMIPMNFLTPQDTAGYIDSGHWAAEAMEYGAYYGHIQVMGSSRATHYDHLPEWPQEIPNHLKYLHITTNNTIYGTQYTHIPKINIPLIADMSSDIFSCARDYNNYDLIYAAAQKNLGTPGVALVIVKKELLSRIANHVPPMLNYKAQAHENSILNTANVSGVYTSLLMLRWIKEKGIANIEAENNRKAELLYNAIDNSKLFTGYVKNPAHRSKMNVCFTAVNKETEQAFLKLCAENNIIGIQGHRSTGGFRVSIYNAVEEASVITLVDLMKKFETNS